MATAPNPLQAALAALPEDPASHLYDTAAILSMLDLSLRHMIQSGAIAENIGHELARIAEVCQTRVTHIAGVLCDLDLPQLSGGAA